MSAATLVTPEKIKTTTLKRGSHQSYREGTCVMELLAMVRGLTITDSMPCVAPDIRRFLISLNDRSTDTARQRLLELIDADHLSCCAFDTAGKGDPRKRAYLMADWAIRIVAPMACDAVGKTDLGDQLRALAEVVDPTSAQAARVVCETVRVALRGSKAAYAAAYDAAYAAADAAADAAYAAYAAAAAYAAYAAYAAAYAYAAAAVTRPDAKRKAAAEAGDKARETMWQKIMDTAIPLVRKLCIT